MGTEVQSKMYLPEYYSMKDIISNTGYGGWSVHHESNSLKNGQHYGIFLSKPMMDGVDYDVYDKEKLRQTIMKHESIFRHQVHELHRLYRIQRDLMNEIKSKEQAKHLIPVGTSQSSLFSSGFPSEDDKRSWYISNFPSVSSDYGRPSSSRADVIQSHQSSMKEKSTLPTYALTQNSARLNNHESLDFKCKKPQRRLFDLELPANAYIDDEMEVQGEVEASRTESCLFNKSNEVTQAWDKNLSNHTGDNGTGLRSNLYSRRTHNLADLNEPIEVEEVSASASVNNLGNEKSQAVSTHSSTGRWCSAIEFSENHLIGKTGGINNLHLKTEMNEKECSSYTLHAGKIRSKSSFSSGIFHLEDFQKPCGSSSRVEVSKANEFVACLPSDQSTTRKQIKRKLFGMEVPEGNNDASAFASKGINLQTMFGPQSDAANSELSSISSWTKPQSSSNQNLISVQGEHGPRGHLWGLGCVNSAKAPSELATPNKYQSEINCKENGVSVDEPRKQEMPQGGLSWLRTMPLVSSKSLKEESEGSYQMKIGSAQNCSQQFLNQTDMRKGPSQSPIQDSSSTTRGHDAEHRRAEISECSSVKRILGFPIFDSPSKPGSGGSVPGDVSPLKTRLYKSDLDSDSVSPKSSEQLKVEDSGKGLVNDSSFAKQQIDLNECITEEEAQPTSPSPNVKHTTGIDLEAPVVVETETGITNWEESEESKLKKPVDSLYESGLPEEKLHKVAAEALVAISSFHVLNLQDNATLDLQENDTLHQSDSFLGDSLHWFADIITSYNETGMTKTNFYNEESPNGIDYFEYMILNLPETKVEECCYSPPNSGILNEEDTVPPRRPRRGHARRGRQRKDFQRDVLPGMVSLSRNEVTEDLQTIEGLVLATGGTWQSSLAHRNGGKGGGGRGRRRSGGSAPSPPMATVCDIQVQQPDSKELGLEERSLTGWGKRTRRPPRQRCPVNNTFLPLK